MMSKSVVLGLFTAGCIAAAGSGAYLAVRQNAAVPSSPVVATSPSPAPANQQQAVAESEALVQPAAPAAAPGASAASSAPADVPARVEKPEPELEVRTARRAEGTRNGRSTPRPRQAPVRAPQPAGTVPADVPAPQPAPAREAVPPPVVTPDPVVPEPARVPETPPAPAEPQFEQVVVPASSVVGLRVDSSLSSERAKLEDRVEASVTRDVLAAGRVAIPAGTRVIGSVTTVERGGKVKERARLGVRFHTLVLANGMEMPIRTEAIFREGDSPANESARKIGGAAIGGAIIGAILGGKKGAVVGGTTGAAGGTAAVMAGDRNAATLLSGTIVTVRLSAPVAIDVEKE